MSTPLEKKEIKLSKKINYMTNNIKISVTNCEYVTDNVSTVQCILTFKLKTTDGIKTLFKTIVDDVDPYYTRVVSAYARLHEGDTFDLKNGKQIARAKAEMKAYDTVMKLLNDVYEKLDNIQDGILNFKFSAYDNWDHNEKFIQNF